MSIKKLLKSSAKTNEQGAALIMALMAMVILLGIVALVFSRTMAETAISRNDEIESLTFNAAEAALEDSTRDFSTIVENKLTPTTADIANLETKAVPYFSSNGYDFVKTFSQIGTDDNVVTLTKGQFQGLVSMRDEWQIDVTATDRTSGVETQLRRKYFNDRIPIFQFGAFYQDDLEIYDPPTFIFKGRAHTNGNFFAISNGNDIRFKSKITVAGEFIRDRWKTGAGLANGENSTNVFAQNTVNVDTAIPTDRGSVTCAAGTGGILTDITGRNFPYPNCVTNPNWSTFKTNFENNLITKAKILSLPVFKLNVPLIEMVRRGKNIGDKVGTGGGNTISVAAHENGVLSRERYANKEGIRVSLADSKDKLPQCADLPVNTPCGVRLDGNIGFSKGYVPLPMSDGYQATALNANRIAVNGREVWIKVEMVDFDYDNQRPITKDITQDILSLGVTEPVIEPATPNTLPGPPSLVPLNQNLIVWDSADGSVIYNTAKDSRSIIKLQRFAIKGAAITNAAGPTYVTSQAFGTNNYNFVVRKQNIPANGMVGCVPASVCPDKDVFVSPVTNGGNTAGSTDESAHYKVASFDNGASRKVIVPFPIEMYDTREGNRTNSTAGATANFLYKNGVMSVVDIDVANLRRFLSGEWDTKFPANTPYAVANGNVRLKSTDIPTSRGWVLYVSDRRGDFDFDGRYNMEDVNAGMNSLIEEDIDNNGIIDVDYANEAPTADSQVITSMAAVTDHSFNRRAVRLINGSTLPGIYYSNLANRGDTKGFTFASENGTYVLGNYNVALTGFTANANGTVSSAYPPFNTSLHIPASIAADSVYILSNNWKDANSFQFGHDLTQRQATATQVRFAMIAGDSLVGNTPTVAGLDPSTSGFNGGLHNFKRFLETWTNVRLNYSGSLINLYNASNNNGRHKSNGITYNPPIRDWTFEDSFANPYRLPPGTPFVYFTTFTGFERVNE